jgi:hypothetical protein
VVKGLPLEEKVPVLVLKKLLEERKEINRKREAEVDQIQAKYRDLMKPNILRVPSHLTLEFRDYQRSANQGRLVEGQGEVL